MSALIPVNSTVSVNDFMNGYFDSVSTVDNIGETDKLLLVQNGELKAASGDNLVSETTIENNFASWANSYLPIGSTTAPSLISGAQSQKLANLTTATATNGTKGYMSAADKTKLDNLFIYENATTTTSGLMSPTDKRNLDRLQPLQSFFIEIEYIKDEPVLSKIQRAFNTGKIPQGVPFSGVLLCGAYYFIQGYWYPGSFDTTIMLNVTSYYSQWLIYRQQLGGWHIVNTGTSEDKPIEIKIGDAPSTTCRILKYGDVRILQCYYGDDIAFNVTHDSIIGQVEEQDIPRREMTNLVSARSQGNWTGATYYSGIGLHINYLGQISIRGKNSDLANVKYLQGQLTWIANHHNKTYEDNYWSPPEDET